MFRLLALTLIELQTRKDNTMKRAILLFIAICFCLVSISSVDAQQRKKQQPEQQKVSQQKQSSHKPNVRESSNKQKSISPAGYLVPEASELLKYNRSTGFTGAFSFQGGTECYSFSYSGEIRSVGLASIYDVWAFRRTFINGIKHEFSGAVCFPVSDGGNYITRLNLPSRFSLSPGTTIQYGNGYVSFIGDAAVSISGDGTIVDYSGPVLRIEGDSINHLILELNSSGYKYISGKGKLTTPAGKTYIFPL